MRLVHVSNQDFGELFSQDNINFTVIHRRLEPGFRCFLTCKHHPAFQLFLADRLHRIDTPFCLLVDREDRQA